MATVAPRTASDLVLQHVDWFNRRELDEGARHVAGSAELVNVAFDATFKGPEGYLEFNRGWATAFPDGKIEVLRTIASGNFAVLEFRGQGTHRGALEAPSGSIAPTGKRVDMHFCEVYEFDNGKIAKLRLYFDTATMMRQLGLTPPTR